MMIDRRTHRSSVRAVALDRLLAATRARGEHDAVIVADDRGLVVGAAARAGVDVEAVAATLPVPARTPATTTTRAFALGDERLYVATLGSHPRDLDATIEGVRRILT